MQDYQGKEVVIIGLGLTGLSCVTFFMARGVTPRVIDTRVDYQGGSTGRWGTCVPRAVGT